MGRRCNAVLSIAVPVFAPHGQCKTYLIIFRPMNSLTRIGALCCRNNHSLFRRTFHLSIVNTMPIQVGDKVPSIELYENSPASKINISELCSGKKVILFAVPGAFTPGCSKTHLPGYVSEADSLKSKGISEIVCVSVNDPFVMGAWGSQHKTEGKVRMLADPAASFTKALDLAVDLAPLGGIRSKRYSMVVEDGVVKELNVEPDGTGLSCSLASHIKV